MRKSKLRDRRERSRDGVFIPTGRGRALDIGGQLDVARCPICDGPMTPRLDRAGPYFHCRCPRKADKETRRQGDKEMEMSEISPCLPVSLSPCLSVSSCQNPSGSDNLSRAG